MLRITGPPFGGTFMVEGGTTENSIGLDVKGAAALILVFSMLLLLEELLDLDRSLAVTGPQTTADYFAKVNSISIS